jgi:hypothetical protein
MLETTKSFNGSILDEVISIFGNKIILCGSLCDYFHIEYDEIIDFDFIVSKSIFLQCLNIEQLNDTIESEFFNLKIKKSLTFNQISYKGNYKGISIDVFLTDVECEKENTYLSAMIETGRVIAVPSNVFYEHSKYDTYLIHSVETRKKRLQELLVKANKKEDNLHYFRILWKEKKISQVDEKLPIYNVRYPND